MATKPLPSPEELRQLLRYDAKASKLYWRRRPITDFVNEGAWKRWNTVYSGREAFCLPNGKGYLVGTVCYRRIVAHRVIWAMHYGRWPVDQIDHINGIRSDNRIQNLREVSNRENQRNRRVSSNSTTGVIGVIRHKQSGRFRARIWVDGRHRSLGHFPSIEAATNARKAAEKQYGFHKNHGRSKDA